MYFQLPAFQFAFHPFPDGAVYNHIVYSRFTNSYGSLEPTLVAVHRDHDVEAEETLLWSLDWLVEADTEQVSESPPRYAVTGTLDGERLRVVVDDALDVVETERGSA